MTDELSLLMLSAMYENGGNTTHRFLDGHPGMFVYPFESQIGTRMVSDALSSLFPAKYRWPVFPLDATPEDDYRLFIDEECRVRARTPFVSKFREFAFDFSDEERGELYARWIAKTGRSRSHNVAAFFRATFEAWKNRRATGQERVYVGYSPIIVVDTPKILADFPRAQVLHVVRNPWSAYADTKRRPVPLSLGDYMLRWTLAQHFALRFRDEFPGRVHLVRFEDVLADPVAALSPVCAALGLEASDTLRVTSFNGARLPDVYPWGTIRKATSEANRDTAGELSERERAEVRAAAGLYGDALGYAGWP